MTQTANDFLFPAEDAFPNRYRIQVKGILSEDLIAWLDLPAQIDSEQNKTNLWIIPPDQAALYGAILRLRDLGLTLLAVELMENER